MVSQKIEHLWLIPALPLLAAGLSALAKQRHRTFASALAIGSMALAFFLSCAAFAATLQPGGHGEAFRQTYTFSWFQFGETSLQLGWVLDPLTASMLVMVTFVGSLIFVYSVGYMAQDENFTRFFCFLSLFAAAMLGLVISNSLLMLFMCWELVGLASYLLIGFWYHKPSAAAAAKKAFITTRIGDIGFFIGLLWLYSETGTLLFYDGGNGCLEQSALAGMVTRTTLLGMGVSTAVGLLIFCGAAGKSGQVPLHVWLPDAMEGPTPVSALIHAATMVAAGVFLVARVYPLMEAVPPRPVVAEVATLTHSVAARPSAPALTPALSRSERARGMPATAFEESKRGEPSAAHESGATRTRVPPVLGGEREVNFSASASVSTALQVVTWVGSITALFAALIALAQTDIKRILAYSTVSQLGFMMMGLGVGGVAVGMFHLLTHAFFKALLFLGAGSVIHGCHEEQDIRAMGGLRKFMPITFATYAIGMMALSGVPLLFSGFWSKDEILHSAWLWEPSRWPFLIGIAGAFLTAFYMTRQMWFVFFAPRSGHPDAAPTAHDHAGEEKSDLTHAGVHEPHESPPVMTLPLGVLAACTVLLSLLGTPLWPWFHSYLGGHGASPEISSTVRVDTLLVMLFSAVIALGGIGLSWWFYSRRLATAGDVRDPLEQWQPDVFAVLRDKFYIDELYEATAIRWNLLCARVSDWLDRKVWNSLVTAISFLILGCSWLNRLVDEFVVNFGFDQGCGAVRLLSRLLSLWQNGQVQRYLRVLGLALAGFALFLIWGWKR